MRRFATEALNKPLPLEDELDTATAERNATDKYVANVKKQSGKLPVFGRTALPNISPECVPVNARQPESLRRL